MLDSSKAPVWRTQRLGRRASTSKKARLTASSVSEEPPTGHINVEDLRRVRAEFYSRTAEERGEGRRASMPREGIYERAGEEDGHLSRRATVTGRENRGAVHTSHRRRRKKPREEADEGGGYVYRTGPVEVEQRITPPLRPLRRRTAIELGRRQSVSDRSQILRTLGLQPPARPTYIRRESMISEDIPREDAPRRRDSYSERRRVDPDRSTTTSSRRPLPAR